MFYQNNTQRISSDVSEVFDWSALEMLSTPESPIWLSFVCERCFNTINNTQRISSDVREVFDWSALEMISAPDAPILPPVV